MGFCRSIKRLKIYEHEVYSSIQDLDPHGNLKTRKRLFFIS